MPLHLANCTETLSAEINDRCFTQKDVSVAYALAMQSSEPTAWREVNEAIMKRWSRSGLLRLKKMAWKLMPPGSARSEEVNP